VGQVQAIKIRLASFDEPAVVALLVDVMAELSARYGGSGDDTPITPADFTPPIGAFFVAAENAPSDLASGSARAPGSVPASGSASGPGSASGSGSASGFGSAERLIGCAGWRRHGDDAELKRMYTAKAARGRGLGRRMLATIEDSAREAGCRRLILETGDRQPEAIALYESAGYVRVEDFGYYAGEEGVLSFAKPL
jgi:ribosomal protein S18 acetylase RimI-like enzyme